MKKLFCTGIASFALALVLAGCGGEKKQAGTIPTLDVEAAIDNPRTFDLSEIAESIEFIPLDDSQKEALVGEIGKLAESNRGFYVVDGQYRPVKLFDRAGKYVSTIGTIGRGPGEILDVMGIAVDYAGDNLYVYSNMSESVVAYDANGRMTARSDSIFDLSLGQSYFADRFFMTKSPPLRIGGGAETAPAADSVTTILEMFSSDLRHTGDIETRAKGTNWIFPDVPAPGERRAIMVMSSPNILSENGNALLVKEGRSDTVFHYRDEALEPLFRLDLGRYTMPDAAYGSNPGAKPDGYCVVMNIWQGDQKIITHFQKGTDFATRHYGVLDVDDPSGGFSTEGPDGAPGLFIDGVKFAPMFVRDNRLVGYVNALDLVDGAESITRPDLKELAASLKEESNPVIVVVTLKK